MNEHDITVLLERVQAGSSTVAEAVQTLKRLPFEQFGFAVVDHHRALRTGFPEVIWGQDKSAVQLVSIMRSLAEDSAQPILATRVVPEVAEAVVREVPEAAYHAQCRALTLMADTITPRGSGLTLVLSAGTSDIAVAEEAALTARVMGNQVQTVYDVGVAGIHRLMSCMDEIATARVIVVVAGMEGALPSVVGGLAACPVIAVPTSTGYGASFDGLAALLGMLNSCSAGVSVVNIDNGFGAGYMAALINS